MAQLSTEIQDPQVRAADQSRSNEGPAGSVDTDPIFELVKADLDQRDRIGLGKYGQSLHAHDGRRTLQDAYEEALDLAIYLKKELIERGQR